jgi:hypothetical protein
MTSQVSSDPLTPAELGQIQDVGRLAQAMVRSVAVIGSGYYNSDVENFQIVWNEAAGPINHALAVMGKYPGLQWFELEVDGKYGKNTRTALMFTLPPVPFNTEPPRKAAGMAAWYAQNRSAIEGWFPPNIQAVEDLALNAPIDAPPVEGAATVPGGVFDAIDNSSGSLVASKISVTTDAGEGAIGPPEVTGAAGEMPNPICAFNEPLPPGCRAENGSFWCPPETTASQLRAFGCYDASEESALEPVEAELFMQDTPVYGTSRTNKMPWVAVGIVSLALGGAFYWWQRAPGVRGR